MEIGERQRRDGEHALIRCVRSTLLSRFVSCTLTRPAPSPLSPLSIFQAFRSDADKAAARASCLATVAANCEDGARFGAGVAAAATCAATRRGFWVVVAERMTGRGPRLEEERVACEVREAEV